MRNILSFTALLLVAILSGACAATKEDTEAERMKKNTSPYTGIPLRVTRKAERRANLSRTAEREVSLELLDEKDIPHQAIFSDQHVDYEKIASLNVGDEVWFRYDAQDGDPSTTSGGFNEMKYLRVMSYKHR